MLKTVSSSGGGSSGFPITLGNTTIAAGSTTTNVGNLTLANATITSGNVTITGGSINVQSTNLVSTTSSTATYGTASLPLQPLGFIQVDLNGTVVKVPYYAV
jgi:lipopolysaccharide export system protein LptA